jgi:peptide/nickel transport system substrate-binding protein
MRHTAWRLFAIASWLSIAAAATRPHYGGTLRIEMQARLSSFDPAQFAAQENLTALAFDRLVVWNDSAQLQPSLAVSWRHDAKFKRWEFQLRPGVKFHDGSPFNAVTAAPSLERLGAVAFGDTLILRSDQAEPDLLARLASAGQSIWKRAADGAPVGTGPFRVQSWEPGRRAVFAANDDYWAGRPYLDAVEIEMGRTLRDQALDFDLGKADIVELTAADTRRMRQSGKTVWTSAPADLVALVFDSALDERVREAIALSIDRATIQSVLLQRQGASTAALLPQWLSGYAFLFADVRDLDRARQIAPRAGAPVTVTYDPQDDTLRAIAERIAVNAHEAGITIRPMVASQIASSRMVRVSISSPDPRESLLSAASTLGTTVPSTFFSLYDAERALLRDHRIVPLFHLPRILGLGLRVRGWNAARWGAWKIGDVWLEARQP